MTSCLSIVGQARATPTGRLLKPTHQLAVKSDVYDCLVSYWTQAVTHSVSSSATADSLLCYYIHLMVFFSRTTQVSRHHKGKPFWILLEQEMTAWQWHQLDHMQIICTSLQTDNHASTSPLSFYTPDALPATQSTVSKHCTPSVIKLLKVCC